jgi:hypothetical protein
MDSLTPREQSTLIFAIGLILCLIFSYFIFSESNTNYLFMIWGFSSICFSILITYVFIFQTENLSQIQGRTYRNIIRSNSFRPNIIRPSKMKKKTRMEGRCSFCNTKTLMGFTCSYCGNYYCTDHRLPEKHECTGLYR